MTPQTRTVNALQRIRQGLPLLTGLVLVLLSSGPARSDLLASYEPSETTALTLSSPDPGMTVSWPVQGGVGGTPDATEGSHILKLDWASETDRKVEVKHQWSGPTFDLAGHSWILVDVFIATPSALPGIVGIWDNIFEWIPGSPVPNVTNQWIEVAMNVFHREDQNLDHIWALLFEELAGDDGTIYLDNLRLVPSREISFAGHDWQVKSSSQPYGPGPNHFSEAEEDLWVDASGRLHMKIVERDGVWYCTEIVSKDSFGHGTYVYTVETRVDQLDPNIVLGAFTWDTDAPPEHHFREIDFEFGRWKDPENQNAQYVIQPWDSPGNLYRFDIDYSGSTDITTHVMTWEPDRIDFTSYYGRFRTSPPAGDIIASWSYTGGDIPPAGGENARINFWLVEGSPPTDAQEAEIVIADFGFRADYPGADCSDGFDNDGDGFVDFPDDPGCRDPESQREAPKCQDGINNDPHQDELIDFDGGQSIHGQCSAGSCPAGVSDPDANGVADPDPDCTTSFRNCEKASCGGCGLGVELLALLAVLGPTWAHRRRR
jgi:hypothetical protein